MIKLQTNSNSPLSHWQIIKKEKASCTRQLDSLLNANFNSCNNHMALLTHMSSSYYFHAHWQLLEYNDQCQLCIQELTKLRLKALKAEAHTDV